MAATQAAVVSTRSALRCHRVDSDGTLAVRWQLRRRGVAVSRRHQPMTMRAMSCRHLAVHFDACVCRLYFPRWTVVEFNFLSGAPYFQGTRDLPDRPLPTPIPIGPLILTHLACDCRSPNKRAQLHLEFLEKHGLHAGARALTCDLRLCGPFSMC